MKIFDQLLASPTLIGLSIALLISSSISIFDVRITQAKKSGVLPPDHPELPPWVGIFHILDWILKITLLILNWKVGLLVWVTLFALKVLPVLETIGNILMAPFKARSIARVDAASYSDLVERIAALCAAWDDLPTDEQEFTKILVKKYGKKSRTHAHEIFERAWEILGDSLDVEIENYKANAYAEIIESLARPYGEACWNLPLKEQEDMFTETLVTKHGEDVRSLAPAVLKRVWEIADEEYKKTGTLYS